MCLKRIIAGVLACTIVFGAADICRSFPLVPDMAYAADAEESYEAVVLDGITYGVGSKDAYVDRCNVKTVGDVVIPDEVNGKPVFAINSKAFQKCTEITSVILPDTITSIGTRAFSEAKCLRKVNIPESVTAMGTSVFESCTSLESITLPKTFERIPSYTFKKCSNLSSVTLPNTTKVIGEDVFYECTSLEEIKLPDTVYEIGKRAFSRSGIKSIEIPGKVESIPYACFTECEKLTKVTLPDSVAALKENAFASCKALEEINIPDSIVLMESGVFSGCASLKGNNIPKGITTIPGSAYTSNLALTSLTIPENITAISDYAFRWCYNLKTLNITKNVKTIGAAAFNECKSLDNVVIPANVKKVGNSAFSKCESLKSIVFENPECEIVGEEYTISNTYEEKTKKYSFSGVIYGYTGSTAEAYANKYGYRFIALDAQEQYTEKTGDVNGDGRITMGDIVTVESWLLGKTALGDYWQNADLCADGVIDTYDMIKLRKYYIEVSKKPTKLVPGMAFAEAKEFAETYYKLAAEKSPMTYYYLGKSVDLLNINKAGMLILTNKQDKLSEYAVSIGYDAAANIYTGYSQEAMAEEFRYIVRVLGVYGEPAVLEENKAAWEGTPIGDIEVVNECEKDSKKHTKITIRVFNLPQSK